MLDDANISRQCRSIPISWFVIRFLMSCTILYHTDLADIEVLKKNARFGYGIGRYPVAFVHPDKQLSIVYFSVSQPRRSTSKS